MRSLILKAYVFMRENNRKEGMEMVQVAILVAIAVALGLLFKDRVLSFMTSTLDSLENSGF